MALLHQDIMNVPGLSGNSYQRQQQLYQKLGSPQGNYSGTYNQNIWLLSQVQKGNYGQPAPAAAPAAAAPGPNAYDQAAATFAAQGTTKDAELKAQEEALLAKRAGFTGSQESVRDLMTRLSMEAGIPALQAQLEPVRQETLTTEEQLRKLAGDVGTLTAGQGEGRRRLVEAGRRAPLVEQLNDLARSQERFAGQLSSAQQGVAQQGQLYGEDYKRRIDELNVEMEVFGTRAARESANWSATRQAQYETTISKIKRAEELDDIAAKRLYDDITAERDYNRSLSLKSSGSGDKPVDAKQQAVLADFSKVLSSNLSKATDASDMYKKLGRELTAYLGAYPQYADSLRQIGDELIKTFS